MIFKETKIKGAFVIELEKREDDRGFFASSWDKKIFESLSLESKIAQCNISFNKKKGTLRGMHYQLLPHAEIKVVRCTAGKVFDVIIDIRPESKTFKQWFSVELSWENRKMLYVPKGCAHGFITLEDNTEIFYQVSEFYSPEAERGILWNDSLFGIEWPMKPVIISEKDKSWKAFDG